MNSRLTATTLAGLAALGGVVLAAQAPGASADDEHLRAVLRDPSGAVVGTVQFGLDESGTTVKAQLRPSAYVAAGTFHGLHIHANNAAANGTGCVADATQASTTWFGSADGHLSLPGQTHGQHAGDLPSPLVMADGTARLRFTTDRAVPADLVGRAVVLHAGADNFGNVPASQYAPLTATALDLTARTGNAGDRVACGVIEDD